MIEYYWDGENWLKVVKSYDLIRYYLGVNLHRNEGPAVIFYDIICDIKSNCDIKIEKFYHHGKIHRNDGPAIIQNFTDGFKVYEYYFNGIEFNPDDLSFEMPIDTEEKEFMFHLKYGV